MDTGDSWASSPAARKIMLGNRSRDTKPELAVRRILHAAGYRYRVAHRPVKELRRTADIVFTRQQVAVFIDGCFWHNCPIHGGRDTKANTAYWRDKLIRNAERDVDTTAQLRAHGWVVLRYWEHQDALEVSEQIMATVEAVKLKMPTRPQLRD